MPTFERFSDLPRELRDTIWSLAIRPDRPGVHTFGLQCNQKDDFNKTHAVEPCVWGYSCLTASPWRHYFDSTEGSRPDKDISTYVIDGGMWTACKESRLVMEKHFRQSEWRRKYNSTSDLDQEKHWDELSEVPSTCHFAGGPLRCFTVFPLQDLFVLQTDDLGMVDWSGIGFDRVFQAYPPGRTSTKHIGIEYRPEWEDMISESEFPFDCTPIVESLFEAIFEGDRSVWKIWFIDHGLKRKEDAPPFEEKTETRFTTGNAFYASDRRLLEVDLYSDLTSHHWEYITPPGANGRLSSSNNLVRMLDAGIHERRNDLEDGGGWDTWMG